MYPENQLESQLASRDHTKFPFNSIDIHVISFEEIITISSVDLSCVSNYKNDFHLIELSIK